MQVMLKFFCMFCSSRNDGSEFGGSIYQKVNDKLETAVNLAWTAGSNGTRFGIAAKYQLDSSASISVSVPQGSYVYPPVCEEVSQTCVNTSVKCCWELGQRQRNDEKWKRIYFSIYFH